MVAEHISTFQNKPVQDYSPATGISDPEKIVYRVKVSYDDESTTIGDMIEAFSRDPQAGKVKALVIGQFNFELSESTDDVVDKLVELKDIFKDLKALFIGDITVDECEMSWIQQTDINPILKAWPALEYLQVRGGEGLTFDKLQHDQLKTLIIETGGMPPNVIQELCEARLPNLERLDLWLGSDNYGFDSTVNDFVPILSGKLFPKLTHLGLMNSEIQDEIAIAVTEAPVLQQLKTLDLSMGTLTDKGAAALLGSEGIRKLEFLNLRRHYLTDGMMAQLKTLGVPINLDDKEEADEDDFRYAEVTE